MVSYVNLLDRKEPLEAYQHFQDQIWLQYAILAWFYFLGLMMAFLKPPLNQTPF